MYALCPDSKEKKTYSEIKQNKTPSSPPQKKATTCFFFLAHKLVWDRELQQVFISEESGGSLT